jgi:hypothetical protein
MLIVQMVGYVNERTGSSWFPILMASLAYMAALAVIQWLMPRLEPIQQGEGMPAIRR